MSPDSLYHVSFCFENGHSRVKKSKAKESDRELLPRGQKGRAAGHHRILAGVVLHRRRPRCWRSMPSSDSFGPCDPCPSAALYPRSAPVGSCPCFAWLERGSGRHHHCLACVSRLVDIPDYTLLSVALRRWPSVSQGAFSIRVTNNHRGHANSLGSNPCLCCMQLSFLA